MNKSDRISENIDIALLLDFYGQLLTERAADIASLHYNEDMSLAEISELLGISRQAVHDTLKRALATITGYESKLKLAEHFINQKRSISDAIEAIDSGDSKTARSKLTSLIEII